jgi:LDH2 family malate/lactate/ureidoglycolate dehydrogenase
MSVTSTITHPFDTHRAQIAAILTAWGMPAHNAEPTADILAWADLHGIDSHGLSMLPQYDGWRTRGRVRLDAVPAIERETPVSALVDGGGGLGHVPARFGMQTAIDKARRTGLAAVSVRNSAHFGACGYYTLMAAEAGLIGIACTSASGIRVAPTGGAEARFGTDPWSFAAPGAPGRPFLLDMATTTVAFGKVRNKANEGLPCPPGWVLTSAGLPSTDPMDAAERGGFLTSLGGSRENGSYKGYGLAAMVNILAAALGGSTLITDPMHTKKPQGVDLGHFFLAIDPGLFRDAQDFTADVARFCDDLRATPPVDPAQPVLVAGDPERAVAARRRAEGVPVGAGLLAKVRELARESGAAWLLS